MMCKNVTTCLTYFVSYLFPARNLSLPKTGGASTGNDERSNWEPQLIVIVKLLAEVLNNPPVNNPFEYGRAILLLFVRHANSNELFESWESVFLTPNRKSEACNIM